MSEFVSIEGEGDASALEQQTVELLESKFEGWSPAQGDLLTWLNKAFSRIGASIIDQATLLSRAAFKAFGEKVVSVPPIQAAPATVESTWTMVDDAGYTIPEGTQVTIAASGEDAVGFVTVDDVIVAPEATAATVLLRAIEPGEAGNELSGDVELSDSLAFVESIGLEGVSAGGVDEEDEDAYLNRLVETLQLLSISLVVAPDFETDARAVPGVTRAKCIEAYDAEEEEEAPLSVTVIPIAETGEASSAPVKEALESRQRAKLLSGVNYFVTDPDYTEVDVTSSIAVQTGFDPAVVVAAVEARLGDYFNPAKWGLPTQGDPSGSGWINRLSVYRFELISEIDRVGGVDRVVTLKLAKHGDALSTAEELVLSGVAPLTKPGDFEVTAV